ncbi:MAG: aminopeptidase [Chlamydiales bacterium]|jgi:aminopeptidase
MTEYSICTTIPDSAIEVAATNLRGVLDQAIEYRSEQAALVVWDGGCDLAMALTEGYRRCLPEATFLDFERIAPAAIMAAFDLLLPGDLVVLVQSTNFRLDAFRIRIELFKRSLKVIEHPHLERMRAGECEVYIESLAYDPGYFRGVGRALKTRIDRAQECVVDSGGERLIYPAALEPAKVNIGDYTGMKNTGGQYPIGEVFTESKDLEAVNGRVRIAFFGDTKFRVNKPPVPITLTVERGRVAGVTASTPDFERVLENIRADEGEVWVRELGFGLNRAFSHERTVSDIGTFERMCGVHLSLGAKHLSYKKPNIRKKGARHHVDVFVVTESVWLDDERIYRAGEGWICE